MSYCKLNSCILDVVLLSINIFSLRYHTRSSIYIQHSTLVMAHVLAIRAYFKRNRRELSGVNANSQTSIHYNIHVHFNYHTVKSESKFSESR